MPATNRLAAEPSPYLRQHADNPVDWYPWGDEAFAAARERDVPILLSVGYSSCHWCHVMAHESFEDEATASAMNQRFVNIKVDREERPDVDAIYMAATQAMTGHGGWPMTVFMTADGEPFFCGTYFPPTARQGMPSFGDVIEAIADAWSNRRDELLEQADRVSASLREAPLPPAGEGVPGREVLATAYERLKEQHDPTWGGFGRAPKFPQTMSLDFLLRAHAHNRSATTLEVVTTSLDAMAAGGIYDHLGGGFSRYSVDARWLVPHFEKMLYDNALLTRTYLHSWQITRSDDHRQVVEETVGYVLRDLRHPDGGFYSAEDADSEGEEGRFYVWSLDEVQEVAGADAQAAVDWYGVTEAGNFEGGNILNRPQRGSLVRPPEVERVRQALFDRRATRIRPGLDDKVLTEWNALMLASLAEAAAVLDRPDWLAAAVANGEFLLANLRRPDGRWLRSWQAGDGDRPAAAGRYLAYAADHANLVDAFTHLYQATGQARWLHEAVAAADALVELFWDPEEGGLFTTGTDAETLLTRPKDLQDNATPGANSVAAVAFLRLAALTGLDRFGERAEAILRLYDAVAGRVPMAFGNVLAAIDHHASGSTEIVVTGDRPDLVAVARDHYLPNAVLSWGDRLDSPLWEQREDGLAYVCQGFTCKRPTESPDELRSLLAG